MTNAGAAEVTRRATLAEYTSISELRVFLNTEAFLMLRVFGNNGPTSGYSCHWTKWAGGVWSLVEEIRSQFEGKLEV